MREDLRRDLEGGVGVGDKVLDSGYHGREHRGECFSLLQLSSLRRESRREKETFQKTIGQDLKNTKTGDIGKKRRSGLGRESTRKEKEKGNGGNSEGLASSKTTEVYKPKSGVILWVVLSNPAMQARRDHMTEHAIICMFMGLWLTERVLNVWIRSHWKRKGEIDLHLGSQGFFTIVFTSLEDKDRVFEGVPYFYVVAWLYMQPLMMNFFPECETFTSVPVWIRLYSLPLDYWLPESLKTIGNKLGHFLKISKATLKGRYTSFARICVEIDISRALPEEIILEVYVEEWV